MTRRAGILGALAMVSACAASHEDAAPMPKSFLPAMTTYAISGSVIGLEGTLQLRNRGADALVVTAPGAFRFPTQVAAGALYAVGITQQPVGQMCVVSNGDGAVTSDVTNVSVSCASSSATIASLHLTQGGRDLAFTPAFRSDVTSYRADLFATAGSNVDVSVATTEPGASWSVNGAIATDGKVTVPIPFTGTIALDLAIESPSRDHASHYTVVVGGFERAIRTDASDAARFGRRVATDGQRIVVSEPYIPLDEESGDEDDLVLGRGRVHIYAPDGQSGYREEATLDAATPTAPGVPVGDADQFGVALALKGDLLVVGAPGAASNPSLPSVVDSGAAFVYRHKATGWTRIAALVGPVPGTRLFAQSVATDGVRIAVGDPNGHTNLFLVNGDDVTFETALEVENASAIAFSGDRVVTASCVASTLFDFRSSFTGNPRIFVHHYDGASWLRETSPPAPNGTADGNCSSAVAASGSDLVVGAPFDATALIGVTPMPLPPQGSGGTPRGAAYVYTRTADGLTASAVARQTDPDALAVPLDSPQLPRYGFEAAIDGDSMLVGAPGEPSRAIGFDGDERDTSMTPSAGAAYLLARNAAGAWQPALYMKPSDTASGLHYGVSVALAGGLAVVGSMRGVYIYRVP